jgi:23S rRNA pseudouridine1911/1915/1917 synthase
MLLNSIFILVLTVLWFSTAFITRKASTLSSRAFSVRLLAKIKLSDLGKLTNDLPRKGSTMKDEKKTLEPVDTRKLNCMKIVYKPGVVVDTFRPQIVFEDESILVIYKPSGLLSQDCKEGDADSNVVKAAQDYLASEYVGLVHRMDRPTSGILVLGKTTKATSRLSEFFRDRQPNPNHPLFVRKDYVCVVNGLVATDAPSTEVRHWLKVSQSKPTVAMEAPAAALVEARLAFTALRSFFRPNSEDLQTILRVSLDTGRKHQIRCQMAKLGFPIVGDSKYGAPQSFKDR